jgi:hypothetical protein
MKEVSYALALICIWREENFGKSGKQITGQKLAVTLKLTPLIPIIRG